MGMFLYRVMKFLCNFRWFRWLQHTLYSPEHGGLTLWVQFTEGQWRPYWGKNIDESIEWIRELNSMGDGIINAHLYGSGKRIDVFEYAYEENISLVKNRR